MNSEKKVVVVDDDQNLINLIEEALNSEGYDILTADNGFSALTLIKKELPGLIILDLIIPRMDGLKLCKKLKEEVKTRNIPILVMSGQPRREHIIELLRMGIKNFLAKPFNVKDLVKRVQQLYLEQPASGELTHIKMRYSVNNDFLNVKLTGTLSFDDIPILIKNIEQHLLEFTNKVILNITEIETFGEEEIKMLEEITNYFEPRNIKIKISAGNSKSMRSHILNQSPLKENILVY